MAGEGLGVRKGIGVWVLAQPFPDFVAAAAVPESTGASWPGCLFIWPVVWAAVGLSR